MIKAKSIATRVASSIAVLLFFVCAFPAVAQTSRGTVTGSVTDSSGAIINSATIQLINKGTGETRSTVTNESGIYRFDAVDLGRYDLKVTAQGFKSFSATNIDIQANRTATFDAQLRASGADLVIDISAGSEEILQKSDAVRGGNFDHQDIVKLPIASLSAYDLGQLVPGVANPAGSGAMFGNGTSQFAVNGQRPRGNNYLLDGTENNDISIGGPANEITNDDAIAEFSIQTGLFSAEFGRAGGGVFNVITKSGANGFHGTGKWLINSQDFNATTNGDRLNGLTSPAVFTENIFGGTFGGPIVKDKTFFFAAVQWDR
ncbi:MAG: carboxypeptidase regulatory-like domain-containing protein, partial [Blastocatellia bacterium]